MYDLYLDTAKRNSGTIGNAQWYISKSVPGSYFNLERVTFFYSLYPVSAHSITFNEDGDTGVTFTASISAGSYGANAYAAAIQTAMNAVGGIANTYTVSFVSSTGKLLVVGSSVTVSITELSTAAKRFTGFTVASSFATSVTSDSIINIAGPLFIDVTMGSIGAGVDSEGLTIMQRVPLNGNFGDFIEFDNSTNPAEIALQNQANSYSIRVVDQYGEVFENPTDISYQFRVQ
jgi:hypothetical protein